MGVQNQNSTAEIIEEVTLLLGTDNGDSIARRLGYAHRASLARTLQKAGRNDLADRISSDDWAQLVGAR